MKLSALFNFVLLIVPVYCGNILFFMPIIPKSSKITWYPLVNQLAARGHHVTTVSPYPSKTQVENIEEIIVDNTKFLKYQDDISEAILKGNLSTWTITKKMASFIGPAMSLSSQSFEILKSKNFFGSDRKFDIVVIQSVGGNEGGYFLCYVNVMN